MPIGSLTDVEVVKLFFKNNISEEIGVEGVEYPLNEERGADPQNKSFRWVGL